MASGGNDISKINTSPPVEAYTLYGAVVGGPDKQDRYYDIRDDWPQTEVSFSRHGSLLTVHYNRSVDRHRLQRTSPHSRRYARYERYRRPILYLTGKRAHMHQINRAASVRPRLQLFTISLSTGAKIAIAVVVTVVGLAIIGGIVYMVLSTPPPGHRGPLTSPTKDRYNQILNLDPYQTSFKGDFLGSPEAVGLQP
jgi:endoglucanase